MSDQPQLVNSKLLFQQGSLEDFAAEMERADSVLPRHVNADPEGGTWAGQVGSDPG